MAVAEVMRKHPARTFQAVAVEEAAARVRPFTRLPIWVRPNHIRLVPRARLALQALVLAAATELLAGIPRSAAALLRCRPAMAAVAALAGLPRTAPGAVVPGSLVQAVTRQRARRARLELMVVRRGQRALERQTII